MTPEPLGELEALREGIERLIHLCEVRADQAYDLSVTGAEGDDLVMENTYAREAADNAQFAERLRKLLGTAVRS